MPPLKIGNNFANFSCMGNFPDLILWLMSMVIERVKITTAYLMILRPNPSTPVALKESSLLIYDSTC